MTITPDLLRKLAAKLDAAQAEVANELKEALGMCEPKVTRVSIPVVGKREVSDIHTRPQRTELAMKRWVEANMTDEERTQQARRKKATKGVTHRITKEINHPRYEHLRKAGFCAGMKFRIVSPHSLNRVVVEHIRSGKRAIMSTTLLETIPDGQF
ncbi:hypothetical protein [Vibrio phage 4141]|uniref:Uncharacterized protein n=2 Tax=Chatterjeevirus TaxID=2732679 RepID=D0Q198_9CAUD|nr:hypothetical protein VN4_14 [Vibrio phage N4]ACR16479.1 hypothetical protein VN4_14 [Vibrio phage N4]